MDGDRLQDAVSPSADTGSEYPALWGEKAGAVVDPAPGNDGAKQRVRRKIHLGIDWETIKVRAVETSGNCVEINHFGHFSAVSCQAVDA